MLSYGKTVIRDKAKFEIESPAPKETNLAIKDVEQTEEGVYRCKTTVNGREIVIGERLLKVEGNILKIRYRARSACLSYVLMCLDVSYPNQIFLERTLYN